MIKHKEVEMSKKIKIAYILHIILIIWFFLSMTGFTLGNHILVTQAWQDDSIFFIIYILAFLSFVFIKGIGKYILISWMVLWFLTQFYFHWWFTLLGPWEEKLNYFSNTVKLIPSTTVYIPDLYHIILHVLILVTLICTIIDIKSKKKGIKN